MKLTYDYDPDTKILELTLYSAEKGVILNATITDEKAERIFREQVTTMQDWKE